VLFTRKSSLKVLNIITCMPIHSLLFFLLPEVRSALGRPRRRLVDNIKMNLREIGWDCIDWIDLAQDRDQWRALVNTVMNLRVP
jgi:hypothetical protein